MKYLPLALLATVVISFSFSRCRKAGAGLPGRLDSLRGMNGDHKMAGRRTGTVSGPDWSQGGAWVTRIVDDTVETTMSLSFFTEDTLFVAFNPGGTCLAEGKYLLKNIDVDKRSAIYKRFGWKEQIDVYYGNGNIVYTGDQSGIHESLLATLKSVKFY